MNLVERLGGYAQAKALRELPAATYDCGIKFNRAALENAMLQYRRQHDIFEVGDKVVIESYRNTCISCDRPSQYSIGDLMAIHNLDGNVISDDDYNFIDYRDVRHATDAEIKAGKRLEVNQ